MSGWLPKGLPAIQSFSGISLPPFTMMVGASVAVVSRLLDQVTVPCSTIKAGDPPTANDLAAVVPPPASAGDDSGSDTRGDPCGENVGLCDQIW